MKLNTYLNKNKIKPSEFADMLKVTRGAISRYLGGSRYPAIKIARKIVKLTDGNVTIEDLYA